METARLVAIAGELATALAGGGLAALVALRADGRRHRGDVVRTDVDRTVDALGKLRAAYRGRALGCAVDDVRITGCQDALDLAARRVSTSVADLARAYLDVGIRYANGDLDVGDPLERAAYDALANALVAVRARYG